MGHGIEALYCRHVPRLPEPATWIAHHVRYARSSCVCFDEAGLGRNIGEGTACNCKVATRSTQYVLESKEIKKGQKRRKNERERERDSDERDRRHFVIRFGLCGREECGDFFFSRFGCSTPIAHWMEYRRWNSLLCLHFYSAAIDCCRNDGSAHLAARSEIRFCDICHFNSFIYIKRFDYLLFLFAKAQTSISTKAQTSINTRHSLWHSQLTGSLLHALHILRKRAEIVIDLNETACI